MALASIAVTDLGTSSVIIVNPFSLLVYTRNT